MKTIQEKTEEYLAISNPNEAYLRLTLEENLPVDEIEKIMKLYMEKHNVTATEMAFYPNGERVLSLEMLQ